MSKFNKVYESIMNENNIDLEYIKETLKPKFTFLENESDKYWAYFEWNNKSKNTQIALTEAETLFTKNKIDYSNMELSTTWSKNNKVVILEVYLKGGI
jgi:viroplasmin and RNaseH domain-containing protein